MTEIWDESARGGFPPEGLRFTDRGRHALKVIEGDWQLYAVEE
jgi:hypothetical protein